MPAFGQTSRPLVVHEATDGSPIADLSLDQFVERFGNLEVSLRDPDYRTALAGAGVRERTTIAEYVDLVARAPENAHLPYLANQPLPAELAAWLAPPPYFARDSYFVRMWLAPPGAVTTLHSDFADNFMVVVFGKKELILFAPDQQEHLYVEEAVPTWSTDPSVPLVLLAEVDPEKPDLTRHPAFQKAREQRVSLSRGDALYIPSGWFHHVRTPELTLMFTLFASHAAPLAYR